jgi:hypothetical protein
MARRHHASKRQERMHREYNESYRMVRNRPDKFNDEIRHDDSPMRMGPYEYDRQDTQYPYGYDRQGERSMHRMGSARGEYYAGAEPRRRQEMADAGMIHEDPRAVANLPQNVMMNYYPKDTGYTPENLDDTLMGIERQMNYDNGKKLSHFYPKKV